MLLDPVRRANPVAIYRGNFAPPNCTTDNAAGYIEIVEVLRYVANNQPL